MIIYIPSLNYENLEVYIYIKCKLYLFNGLKANILIINNIFYTKDFLINFADNFMYIQSYDMNNIINTKYYSLYLKCKVLANVTTFISTKSKVLISFKQIFLSNLYNFLFYSFFQLYFILYTHFVDYIIFKVLVKNNTNYYI